MNTDELKIKDLPKKTVTGASKQHTSHLLRFLLWPESEMHLSEENSIKISSHIKISLSSGFTFEMEHGTWDSQQSAIAGTGYMPSIKLLLKWKPLGKTWMNQIKMKNDCHHRITVLTNSYCEIATKHSQAVTTI